MSQQVFPLAPTGEVVHDVAWPTWLRTVLLINLTIGMLDAGATAIATTVFGYIASTKAAGLFWLQPWVLASLAGVIGLPALLAISTIKCLRLRPAGRVAMIIWCWCALGLVAFGLLQHANSLREALGDKQAFAMALLDLRVAGATAAAPLLTLLLLTRPPIKQLFVPLARGFEIIDRSAPQPPTDQQS
jgi:hypothetical protein